MNAKKLKAFKSEGIKAPKIEIKVISNVTCMHCRQLPYKCPCTKVDSFFRK